MPDAVRQVLMSGAETVSTNAQATNRLVGANSISVQAMAHAAGPQAQVAGKPLEGDVQTAADYILSLPKSLHLMGGETTVQIKGTGKGQIIAHFDTE